jgi:hypothetical protein
MITDAFIFEERCSGVARRRTSRAHSLSPSSRRATSPIWPGLIYDKHRAIPAAMVMKPWTTSRARNPFDICTSKRVTWREAIPGPRAASWHLQSWCPPTAAGRSGVRRQHHDRSRNVAMVTCDHPLSQKADCRNYQDSFGCHPGSR